MERVAVHEKELWRLSALLEEHQAVLRSSLERPHQEPPTASNLNQLRHEVIDHLPGTMNNITGQHQKQVKSLTWVGHPSLRGTPSRTFQQMPWSQ